MYSDAWGGSTPAQSLPAGAVIIKGTGPTNPEIFRRGCKSAGPPSPELPADMDDSDGVTTTTGAQVRGALDGSVPASQTAEWGYAHERATFETPTCGQRTETDDGYAPGPMHGVAYGAPKRHRMNDMTADYDYDAHAASYDARPRAVNDVEGGYVNRRVSDGYARTPDAATRKAAPRRASDGTATQTQRVGRMSDTGFNEGYAPGCVSDYAPDSYECASAAAPVDRVQRGHAAALLRFERGVMSASQTETIDGYVPGRPRPSDCISGRESEVDGRRAAVTDGQTVQCYQREVMCDTNADFVDDFWSKPTSTEAPEGAPDRKNSLHRRRATRFEASGADEPAYGKLLRPAVFQEDQYHTLAR